ncbi:MAG TPA: BatA and WFA domain-containing protein [Terriglobia bacterium]
MGFLSPWFLLGALAVAVPIWVHLIRREQALRVPFSSLMFLRRVPIKSVYRQKLQHMLLLASRALLVLLIAAAFARPYIRGTTVSGIQAGARKRVAIVLDNSMSMQVGNRWERALEAAGDAIAGLSETDDAQIVSFASEFQIQNLPTSDKTSLRTTLAGLIPTASTTSYEHAFRAVERLQEDSDRPLSVLFISDMQRAGLGGSPQMLPAPSVAEFRLVDVGEENVPNWTIEDVRVRPRIYRARYPERLRVIVRGFGTEEARKEVVFSLTGKIMQRKTVQIPASGVATVEFDAFDVPVGSNRGDVRISPADGLALDDSFHFTLERRVPYRLLFLREPGEERELYYLRNALGAESDSPWVLDDKTPAEALSLSGSDYTAVILSNVSRLPNELVSLLRAVVGKGGGVLITAGNRLPSPALEEQLKELWPARTLERRMFTRDTERLVLLGEFERDHPIFRELEESGAESLRSVEVYAYLRLQPENKVLLRLANGDPALVERTWDQGRVLLFASSFDNVWSDFPLHPVFLPLVHQLVRYTAQLPADPPAYRIPTTISLASFRQSTAATAGFSWDVVGPDGKRELPLEQERRPDYLVLRQPGFYEVQLRDGEHLIAANPDPLESDLQQLPAEDRALWQGSGQQPEQAAVAASASESERRQAFWWTLLLLALVIALAEIYLANPFLGRRKAVLPPDGLKENLYVSP